MDHEVYIALMELEKAIIELQQKVFPEKFKDGHKQ